VERYGFTGHIMKKLPFFEVFTVFIVKTSKKMVIFHDIFLKNMHTKAWDEDKLSNYMSIEWEHLVIFS
jgi:hypothetical protein